MRSRISWVHFAPFPALAAHFPGAVELASSQPFSSGKRGRRFDRVRVLDASPDARAFFAFRAEHPIDVIAGWLEKLGGVKGGTKAWKRRWCVLAGPLLHYYESPADATPKGSINVTGCVAAAGPDDDGSFSLSWGEGQPVREFRAEGGRPVRERWVEAVKRVLRVERSKGSGGGANAKLRAAGGAGASGSTTSATSAAAADEVRELGRPDPETLCFVLGDNDGGGAGGSAGDAPPCFVAGSMRDYDFWYTGLNVARDAALGLSLPQRLERYTALAAASPLDAVARVLLGGALEDSGRPEDALAAYEAAVAAEPRLLSARRALGRFLLNARRDAAAALPHLEVASALADREDFEAATLLGRALTAVGAHAAAVPVLEHALVLEPRSAPAHVFVATSLAALSRLDDAIKHLRLSLSANPRQALVHAALGDLLTTQGRPEDALSHFNDALALDASLTPVLEHVALALEALGRHREAIAYRERVLESEPDNVDHIVATAQAFFLAEHARAQRLSVAAAAAAARGCGAESGVRGTRQRGTSLAPPRGAAAESSGGGDGDGDEDEDGGAGGGSFEEGDGEAAGGGSVSPGASSAAISPAGASAGDAPAAAATAPAPSPKLGPAPLSAPAYGALPVDKMSALEVLTAAESLLVRALTLRPESPTANILCAKVFERFADLERDALVVFGMPEGVSPEDEVYASGWTPNQRRDSARAFYEYVVAAYPQPEYVEASLNLAQLLLARAAPAEALAVLREAVGRAPDHAGVADLLSRVTAVMAAEGGAEDGGAAAAAVAARPPSKRRPGPAAPGEIDMTGVDMSLVKIDPGMSEAERKHQFWLAMRATRAAEAEEKKRKEEARVAAMTEEERDAYRAEKQKLAQHEERKAKMHMSQLGAYGSASAGASSRALGGSARGGRGGRGARRGGKP